MNEPDAAPAPADSAPVVEPATLQAALGNAGLGEAVLEPQERQGPLGAVATSGFAWNLVAGLAGKVIGFTSQIVLARLLIPDDYGAYAQAMIIVGVLTIFRDIGLYQALIHRQKQIKEFASAAFWLSVALGVGTGVVILGVSPWARWYFNSALVEHLLWIQAAASPIFALAAIPNAIIFTELRFKLQAKLGVGTLVSMALVSMALAALHCGAYALMLGMIAGTLLRVAVLLFVAFPTVRPRLELHLWRVLWMDSALITVMSIFHAVINQADYMTLSARYKQDVVGQYFFAFNLSLQAVTLVVYNLTAVLFPTLTLLRAEPDRQADAYVRASRLLAIVGTPLCVMQAVLAEQFITLVYGRTWSPAIPLLQVLSITSLFLLMFWPSVSMLQAQGRLRLMAIWSGMMAAGFVALIQIGVRLGGPMGVAWAVSLGWVVACPVQIWMAAGRRLGLGGLIQMFAVPLLGSALAAALPIALRLFAPAWTSAAASHLNQWTFAIAAGLWMTLAYGVFVRVLAPADSRELSDRFKPYLAALLRRVGLAAPARAAA